MRMSIKERILIALRLWEEEKNYPFVIIGQIMYVESKNLGIFEINLN